MPTQPAGLASTFIVAHLLASAAAQGQDAEVLLLPEERSIVDSLTRAGTVQWSGLAGLSRVAFTDVNETYYVIDQVAALRGSISKVLADVWRNDSDLSIRFDSLGGEFIHLRLTDDEPEVRYFRFVAWLHMQLSEFFESGAHANDGGSVEFLEYGIPNASCPELGTNIDRLEAALEESVGSIGTRPARAEVEEIIVDGPYYQLTARMNGVAEGSFGVGANAGSLFDAVHSIMLKVRECARTLEPAARVSDF